MCVRLDHAEPDKTQNNDELARTNNCDNAGTIDSCQEGLTVVDRVRMVVTRWLEKGDCASNSNRSVTHLRATISPLLEGVDLEEHDDILQVHLLNLLSVS